MATWHEIGQQNYAAGRDLLNLKQYCSSISRFYYAAFSLLTYELRELGVTFGDDQETPNHKGCPNWSNSICQAHTAWNVWQLYGVCMQHGLPPISDRGVRPEDNWWEVVVQPGRKDIRSYDYYGRLGEAENDLEDKENLNILLVPVLPPR